MYLDLYHLIGSLFISFGMGVLLGGMVMILVMVLINKGKEKDGQKPK